MTQKPPPENVVPLKPLTDGEIAAILADIARKGSPACKIQALRMLFELEGRKPREGNPFADLEAPDPLRDLDDFRPRRRAKRPKKPPA